MTDTLSIFAGTIWAWLNAEQNAGALSAVLAVLTLTGGAGGWLWQRKSKAPAPDQTGGTHVSASTGGASTGESMTGNTITTNHGATPDQIAAIFAGVRDLSASSEAKAIAVADQFGTISREALTSFFTILRHEQVPPEQLTAKLTSIALQYREMVDRLTALEQSAGPDDRPTLAEARISIEKGDYDHAERLLVTLENAQAAARAKAQANVDDLARRQAATRAERARLSALRSDHRAAADHFLAAANLLPTGDTEGRGNYLTDSADALRQHGDERGDNNALLAAIARYREAMPSRDSHATLWARVQNNLGLALTSLGERDGDSIRLRQAVDAHNNALLERTRDRVPLDWAMTQNNLGNALLSLGERDGDSTRLRQAVDAYNNALLEWTRDRVPLDWAITQNNLGNALSILGERDGDSAQLRQSVDAYNNALLERTRDRVPLDWAMTQNNLGVALRRLGERDGDSTGLRQAVDAYNNALLEYTRDRVPLDWAMTQNNLGAALQSFGERDGDSTGLRQAVDAYNNALLEYTRDRVPLHWAMTQSNMGNALRALAEQTRDMDSARQAVTAQEAALEMFTHLNAPYHITLATDNLATARATLTKLESSAAPAPHQ
ncbi:tetratricopeptide repeat protein [Azospirillum lipoferum]|uniref:Tetratricopeptide repeat protein n=1 Tax=Azospirillum lipoferum (strain 4B) TaxID=862719 RepID=G7Z2V5_AZOL4|nr:tetratricopeptide repeat protein [Azospirillum lipoferum]CBS85747.1 conserved protein of unknown function; putative coiled-coil and TPR domains [Azospirillum lipoferum 4B]